MARAFIIAFFAGVLLVGATAALLPLPTHVRYPSVIAVQPDGGRQEDFIIRWPEDRIPRAGEERGSLPAGAVPGAEVLEDTAGQRASAEMFRLRDAQDNVIGVASRIAGTGVALANTGRSATNWLLVIPSRGALLLAQADALDATVRQALTEAGPVALAPGESAAFWRDRTRYRVTAAAAGATGRVLRGTDEFSDLSGRFTETWELDELNADGSTRGRVVLSTILSASN